jgi:hypothetical protein
MAQFEAFDSRVEVNGQTVMAVVDGMQGFGGTALRILGKWGIAKPDAEGIWYPQQAWLNAFREISSSIGTTTLLAIGRRIPENAAFPPEIDDIETALAAIDVAYHMNHRIGEQPLFDPSTGTMSEGIGHYGFKRTDVREAVMCCNNPYPCDFDRGIIEAMARRFRPDDSARVYVEHLEGECRKDGGESCTYRVRW